MPSPVIVLGTRNRKKRDELVELLDLAGLTIVTLADQPPTPEVVEDCATFAENAAKKASETARALGEWVLGEDSGLCVDALGGAPGIYSARYAGEPTNDSANNQKLLAELGAVPPERRTAHYVCSIAVADPTGTIRARAEGKCFGRIASEERGTNGFGYDPLFLFGVGDQTFGELPADFKRTRSHRAHAVAELRPQLIALFGVSPQSFGATTMTRPIAFEREPKSNEGRANIAADEPIGLRTFTPSQLVISHSAGIYHFTPEGRRLADFTSGVLVANLGHNPPYWMSRLAFHMGWTEPGAFDPEYDGPTLRMPPLTAYNAITTLEVEANRRLLASLRRTPLGNRLQQVMWSASGSEGVQKALWSCLAFQKDRDVILATRHGFHGKKGLSEAVTGDETSPNRDPRVRFIHFPREECRDVDDQSKPYDVTKTSEELERLWQETGGRINCLITEPYLGGGGSYHPPMAYHAALQDFCRRRNVMYILDEVQSNFGRTGEMYAFEKYNIEPDIVVLGKGLGNGIPVNCAVGRSNVFASVSYGGASDTWSGHPLGCAAVLATLDVFDHDQVLERSRRVSRIVEDGLRQLKRLPHVAAVRGEGMVWGVELADYGGRPASEVAVECVRDCYLGDSDGNAIHLLGPLAGKVIRISPPLTMAPEIAGDWMEVLFELFAKTAERLAAAPAGEKVEVR